MADETQDEQPPAIEVDENHSAIERHPDFAYPVDVAPSDLDDDAFFNTLRPGLTTVACWRLEDGRFQFDSSFILPGTREDVARLAHMHKDFGGCPASIFGHADPVGTDDYNKKLSGYRAKAVFGLLVQDVKIWEELHDEHGWNLVSAQIMVLFFEKEDFIAEGNDGDDFIPLFLADGKDTKPWRDALKRFQQKNGLSDKAGLDKKTRTKLYELYMAALCKQPDGTVFKLDKEKDFLGEGKGTKGKAAFQGCSEFNPSILLSEDENKEFEKNKEDGKKLRNEANSANRRVVLYFFPPGLRIDPQKWPCPRADEGSGGCKKRFWSNHDERRKPAKDVRRIYGRDPDNHLAEGTHDTFACRFYDRLARRSPCEAGFREWIVQLIAPGEETLIERERLVGITFVANADGRKTEGVTNAEGIVRVRARKDAEKVFVDLTIPREQEEGAKEAKPPAKVRLTLIGGDLTELEDDDTGKTVEARLRNLGYGPADTTKWNKKEADKAIADFKEKNEIGDGDDLKEKVRELHGS